MYILFYAFMLYNHDYVNETINNEYYKCINLVKCFYGHHIFVPSKDRIYV